MKMNSVSTGRSVESTRSGKLGETASHETKERATPGNAACLFDSGYWELLIRLNTKNTLIDSG